MSKMKPVSLPGGAFAFCRTTIAILFWASLILQNEALTWVGFLILLSSGILTVKYAPLINLWLFTFEKIKPTAPEVVDANGIRFSHFVGAFVSALALVFFALEWTIAAWATVCVLAILQTSAAFGFCSALKLYQCMNSGTCCRVGKAVRKIKHV